MRHGLAAGVAGLHCLLVEARTHRRAPTCSASRWQPPLAPRRRRPQAPRQQTPWHCCRAWMACSLHRRPGPGRLLCNAAVSSRLAWVARLPLLPQRPGPSSSSPSSSRLVVATPPAATTTSLSLRPAAQAGDDQRRRLAARWQPRPSARLRSRNSSSSDSRWRRHNSSSSSSSGWRSRHYGSSSSGQR